MPVVAVLVAALGAAVRQPVAHAAAAFTMNKVATDYNAGLTSALVRMYSEFGGTALANFPAAETPDGPELFIESSINASGSNFTEVKALVYNKSAWPARALTQGSFRYYFTLDGTTTPSQITLSSAYNQCSATRAASPATTCSASAAPAARSSWPPRPVRPPR
ncbi:cellulose binding domain-containing protein [Dactylosporangium sp. CA-092794]|uniref:cellulose binding domain-containing protein n=1 Tax=Dactylosporangium sp. CA-092794 TaxID=3239929 RepID=UPI003D92F452